ncbi:MAG TPA: hypothetical protein VKG79_14420, partial [Bryobacteraceae bacterium]|nr:hypothetical protein [Bryobacteraceae bacterium]
MRRFSAPLLSFMLTVSGQQIGQNNSSATGPVTFQTSTTLVVETVSIKDKDGQPVEGLTAKDFTITEDGVPQTIKFFEYQKLDEPAAADSAPAPPNEPIAPLAKYPHSQITPEAPGDFKYRDR